jgi:hypothetical protein
MEGIGVPLGGAGGAAIVEIWELATAGPNGYVASVLFNAMS